MVAGLTENDAKDKNFRMIWFDNMFRMNYKWIIEKIIIFFAMCDYIYVPKLKKKKTAYTREKIDINYKVI